MSDRILQRIRGLVRTSRYVMTDHGHEEMESDHLTVFDVEHCILTGRIIGRQKDRRTGEWKYLVEGEALEDEMIVTITKIGPTDKLVIITVYRL